MSGNCHIGDCREVLRDLAARGEWFQTVAASPIRLDWVGVDVNPDRRSPQDKRTRQEGLPL